MAGREPELKRPARILFFATGPGPIQGSGDVLVAVVENQLGVRRGTGPKLCR